jgi:hypothetical protein
MPTICTSGSLAKISIKAVPPRPTPMMATRVVAAARGFPKAAFLEIGAPTGVLSGTARR